MCNVKGIACSQELIEISPDTAGPLSFAERFSILSHWFGSLVHNFAVLVLFHLSYWHYFYQAAVFSNLLSSKQYRQISD